MSNVWGGGYKIPSGQSSWQDTNPNDFNAALTAKNTSNHSLIKPTIRLMKFWNADNGNIFDSYSLEKWVVGQTYWLATNQRDYLFQSFEKLPVPSDTQWRKAKVEQAKKIITATRRLEAQALPYLAEAEIKKLIPA